MAFSDLPAAVSEAIAAAEVQIAKERELEQKHSMRQAETERQLRVDVGHKCIAALLNHVAFPSEKKDEAAAAFVKSLERALAKYRKAVPDAT